MNNKSTPSERDPDLYRSGVGAALFNDYGEVFVAKRIDTPSEAWQMPQGGMDRGEAPKDAVMRELKEEIGTDKAEIIAESAEWLYYDIPAELSKTLWKGRYLGQKQKWFALRFTGRAEDIVLDADDHPEFNAWQWTSFARIPDLIVPFKRTLYARIVTMFSHIPGHISSENG
ncbi:putative (di)nucleoside polyphosphate hydrolase [Varunaivibrio sulfuroxidans]|uniref:RNA pyrophosphohydrolase n=2 Tax=Varunaivibrio sulfuroxidans TaxID=1773489 RepID=A0A4R3J690_9PROT|nr:putative (di)nucleoside polyphosphate hydrolase [Varunaivibrio sulfuroxidans]WES32172.1 RNA pyrophosphohydrolase [Varunaivibrio sulfuroxidans]